MKHWIGAAAALLAVAPACAAEVATCTLGADKKTVTVTANNPYAQVMACEVNCHMDLPGGFATVVCVKPVPVGAKDFVMCTDKASGDHLYTRVKGTTSIAPIRLRRPRERTRPRRLTMMMTPRPKRRCRR